MELVEIKSEKENWKKRSTDNVVIISQLIEEESHTQFNSLDVDQVRRQNVRFYEWQWRFISNNTNIKWEWKKKSVCVYSRFKLSPVEKPPLLGIRWHRRRRWRWQWRRATCVLAHWYWYLYVNLYLCLFLDTIYQSGNLITLTPHCKIHPSQFFFLIFLLLLFCFKFPSLRRERF